MIPQDYITAWSRVAPWASQRQVEQDLIISRALVAIFSDPFLRGELRFRGGTALTSCITPHRCAIQRTSTLSGQAPARLGRSSTAFEPC